MLQSSWVPEPTTAGDLAAQVVEPADGLLPVLDAGLHLQRTSEELTGPTARERRQRDFMMVIGHELRSPLTMILGYAELMQRSGTYDEQALMAILTQGEQLNRLIGDLLDSSSLEAGRLRLHRTRTDVVALARVAAQQAQVTSPVHVVRLESPVRPLEGWWDGGRLEQVFANLLGNAIKYSPDGGEVVLRIDDLGSEVRLSVEDEGEGIEPVALPHIFDPYYRAPRTAGRIPGFGLGLHLARALVEAHGGELTVESLVGRGSVFNFTLPRAPLAPPLAAGGLPNVGRPSHEVGAPLWS